MAVTAKVVIEVIHNDGKTYASLQNDLFDKNGPDQLNAIRKYFRQIAGGTAGNATFCVNVNDGGGVKSTQTLTFAGTTSAAASQNDVITMNGIALTGKTAPSGQVQWQSRALVTVASSTGIDTTTDILTAGGTHYLTLGEKLFLTTQTTAPTGLVTATNYYAIPLSATTFKLAATYLAALKGEAIDITSVGTGNQYFNSRLLPAQALAACINAHTTLCNQVYATCSTADSPIVTVSSLLDGLAAKAIPIVKTTGTNITIGSGGNVLQSGTDSTNGKTSLNISVG